MKLPPNVTDWPADAMVKYDTILNNLIRNKAKIDKAKAHAEHHVRQLWREKRDGL